MEFSNWMQLNEVKLRKLSSPATYGKKKPRRPNKGLDGFIKEMDALKKDSDALAKKQKSERPETQPTKVGDDELFHLGQIAYSNLKISPRYYSTRMDDLGGDEALDNPKRKVTREESTRIAKRLGIDFKVVKFTPDAFRKGLEIEVARSHKPSNFEKSRKQLTLPFGGDEAPEENPGGRTPFNAIAR